MQLRADVERPAVLKTFLLKQGCGGKSHAVEKSEIGQFQFWNYRERHECQSHERGGVGTALTTGRKTQSAMRLCYDFTRLVSHKSRNG